MPEVGLFMVFPAVWLLKGWHANDLVWWALCKANVPSVKEPSGLVRDNGKRPDGSTLIPWHAGKSMAWDITVVNMLAESHLSISASPGGAAEHAAVRKSAKYSSLLSSHIFQPLALETVRWPYEHNRHYIPIRAGPQSDGPYRRLAWNVVSFPAGLLGGPAIQFGGFLGHFSGKLPTELD